MKFCSILPAGLPICAEYRCNRSLIAATGQPQQVCAALFKSQSLSRDGPDNVAQRYGRYAERNHSEYEYTHQSIVTGPDSAPTKLAVSTTASIEKIRTTAPTSLIDAPDPPNARVPRQTLSRSTVQTSSPPNGCRNDRGHHPFAAVMPPFSPQRHASTFRVPPDNLPHH